ncbi:SGNH/GDSL hydrolase family protein, partial [Amycolatopsis sp. SID8362]|nr:SGNH/GDSL hydrolase family protein [Amycolatopsis sp. SID8362]
MVGGVTVISVEVTPEPSRPPLAAPPLAAVPPCSPRS